MSSAFARTVTSATALLVVKCTFLFAQNSPATIYGKVNDTSGAAVAGAQVNLHQIAGSALLTATSDEQGRYSLPAIAPGEYLLDANAPGLTLVHPRTVTLTPNQSEAIDLELSVSASQSQITVTAAAAPQSVDETSKALNVVDASAAQRRGLFSLTDSLRFLPGLRVSTRGGPGAYTTVQTRGLRYIDTGFLIDGFRFRDPTAPQADATAFLGNLLFVDTTRVEVMRGSGSSLYGTNSMSGTVNIITDPGGGSVHGDLDLQGGGLGLFRGLAQGSGGLLANRLTYSAGVSHLNVTEGVDQAGATRNWSGQGTIAFALTPNIRLAATFFGSTAFLQPSVSPMPTYTAPTHGVIPGIPLTATELSAADRNRAYDPGNATFVPSLGDPDLGIHSHFVDTLYRLEHQVTSRLSYRIGYSTVNVTRNNTDGPSGPGFFQPLFNTSNRYTGRVDTVQARVDYIAGPHQVLSAGYEFEREHYQNVVTDQNPTAFLRSFYKTDATQRYNAAFAQDELRLLDGRLQVLLSGRFTSASLDQPLFTGATSPYAATKLPSPPAEYTGDASLAYFVRKSSTKWRAHTGNSFRLPSIYERFGGYLFAGIDYAYGDPRLSPERSVSFDFGFDQYLLGEHLKLSGTYFYSRLQQVVGFLSFPPGYVDPYGRTGGYYNAGGGLSRGIELSSEFRPARSTSIFASYTFTNARDRSSEYFTGTASAPLQVARVLPHMATVIATQQLGKHFDLGMDFQGGSDYLYPLYGYAYRFAGPRQLGLNAGYSFSPTERVTARVYVRVSNALDQDYYEDGFRTPRRWAVAGVRFGF